MKNTVVSYRLVPEQPVGEVLIEVEKAHDRRNIQPIVSQNGANDHFPSVVSAYPKVNLFTYSCWSSVFHVWRDESVSFMLVRMLFRLDCA
jgi:hypothetical protein